MAEIVIDIKSNQAKSKLDSLRTSFERTDKSIGNAQEELDKFNEEMLRTGKYSKTASGRLVDTNGKFAKTKIVVDSATQSVSRLNKGVIGLVGAIGGLYGVKSAFDSIQVGFKTLETASLEVSKTTGLVGDDLKRLTNELDNMSTTMGGFEVKGLYAIAESAGQLGIKGVDNLKQFTKEMQYMASSSKLTAEEASTGFAELSNSMGLPISEINRLTSSFSKLASSTTADEAKLLDFTQRLAGDGRVLGLTVDQLGAIGATMKDVGINVEVGGTAMSQVFKKMLSDTESFAKTSNIELSEYSKMIDEKPVKALEVFLESLGKLDKRAKIQALDEMKLSGGGLSSTLLKLSSATEKLETNIKTSTEAYKVGDYTMKEWLVTSTSLESQQKKLSSNILLLKKAIGDELKPALVAINNTMVETISWTKENGKTLEELAVIVGSVTVAYYALTNAQKINTAWSLGQGAIGMVGQLARMNQLQRAMVLEIATRKTLLIGQRALNTAMRIAPWGIFIAGATEALYHSEELAESLVNLSIEMGLNTELARTRAEIKRKTEDNMRGELALETRKNELEFQSLSKREQANIIYTQQLKLQKGLQVGINETLKNSTFSDKAKEKILTSMGDKLSASFTKTANLKNEFKDLGKVIEEVNTKTGTTKNKPTGYTPPKGSTPIGIPTGSFSIDEEKIKAEQRIEQLKRFEDAYQKSTLSNYEYSVKSLMKERDEYEKLGWDKLKISEWYKLEFGKLEKERTDKIKSEQDKLDKESQKSFELQIENEKKDKEERVKAYNLSIDLQNQESKISQIKAKLNGQSLTDVELLKEQLRLLHLTDGSYENQKDIYSHKIELLNKEVDIKNAIKSQADKIHEQELEQIQENSNRVEKANNDKLDGERAYLDLIGDDRHKEINRLWEIKNELAKDGRDYTLEEIKNLEKQRDLNREINSLMTNFANVSFDSFVQNLKDGISVKLSVSNALDAGAKSAYSSMKNSDNPTLKAIGYGVDIIEALGTDLIDLQTDIGADSKSFVSGLDTLNSATYKHTPYFVKMTSHLENMDRNFGSMAQNLYYGSTDYRGADFESTSETGSLGKYASSYLTLGVDVGGFAGDVLDGVAHFISNSETTLKKAGIDFGEQIVDAFIAGVDVQSYELLNKKSSFLGVTYSNKDRMKYSTVDDGTKDAFQETMGYGYGSIIEASLLLGLNEAEANLANYTVDIGALDFKDKTEEEIRTELEGIFSNQFNAMTLEGVDGALDNFRQHGEEYYSTLIRVSIGFDHSTQKINELGLKMADFGNIVDDAHLQMLTVDTSTYIDSMLTEQQRLEIEYGRIESTLNSVGLTVPKTDEAFVALVDSLDLNTTKGQEQYAVLMQTAGATHSYNEAVRSSAEVLAESTNKILQDAYDLKMEAYNASVSTAIAQEDSYLSVYGAIASYEEQLATSVTDTSSVLAENANLYSNYLDDIGSKTEEMISTARDSFTSTINELKGIGQTEEQTLFEQLVSFNKEDKKFNDLLDSGASIDSSEFQNSYSELLSISSNIGSGLQDYLSGVDLKDGLISVLEQDKLKLDDTTIQAIVPEPSYGTVQQTADNNRLTETSLMKDEILWLQQLIENDRSVYMTEDGFAMNYAKSHEMSAEQSMALWQITQDGDLTNSEIEELRTSTAGFSQSQIDALYAQTGILNTIAMQPDPIVNVVVNVPAPVVNVTTQAQVSTTPSYTYEEAQAIVDRYSNVPIPTIPNIGFASGGYTGNMGVNDVAGVVHGQEYVVPKNGALVMKSDNRQLKTLIDISKKLDRLEKVEEELKIIKKINVELINEKRRERWDREGSDVQKVEIING